MPVGRDGWTVAEMRRGGRESGGRRGRLLEDRLRQQYQIVRHTPAQPQRHIRVREVLRSAGDAAWTAQPDLAVSLREASEQPAPAAHPAPDPGLLPGGRGGVDEAVGGLSGALIRSAGGDPVDAPYSWAVCTTSTAEPPDRARMGEGAWTATS